ncbi:hybrid sensor histidine kinase/response regulator transcription factor [Flavobacterium sp. ASW18X]|uniref:hybrid sensor histidine kinase/response regulator transcription factor n=1 Tax=Flavobacterium sp. ASW18X TaxID=2572595 RepID=UPI00146A9899|nr:hybrid sensor histidine kinase/response regulator transcription factor [Flavobacterium sp. ASW18X]
MKTFHLLICLLTITLNYPQESYNPYTFSHLGTSDGLSQSSVIAMEQDNLDRMWLGTRDGLNLYYGSGFRIFRNNPSDSTTISNSDILTIKEDSQGYIWIGTYNGLNKYDPIEDSFTRYYYYTDKNSLCDNSVWAIEETADGKLWIGTANGLSIYNKKTNHFINYQLNEFVKDNQLSSNFILSIKQAKNGTIWIGTSKGLFKASKKDNHSYDFKSISPLDSKHYPYVQNMSLCDDNTICIGTKNLGLLQFDLISESFIPNKLLEQSEDVRAIISGNNGELWVGTSKGIAIISPEKHVKRLEYDPNDNNGLSHNYIKSVFKDCKGSIWIGSYYGGIDIWDESNTNFINLTESDSKTRLSHKVVSSIVEDSYNNLYFGTEGGGITILNTNDNQTKYLNTANTEFLESNNIKSLLIDQDILWIGTFDKGIETFNLKKNKQEPNLVSTELNSLLENTGIYSITKGVNNEIWIGTFGKGIWRYNLKDKSILNYRNKTNSEQSLSSNRVRCLMVGKNSNVWVGTQSGLNLLTIADSTNNKVRIKRFFYDINTSSGEDILTLFQDTKGVIWVGTRAKGLFRFNGNTFKKVTINTSSDITSIYAMLQGNYNTMWLSSNEGLIKYDINNRTFQNYSEKDGLVGNEFSSGAALKQGKSKFLFGGPNGVSIFYENKLTTNSYSPQVILTDFKLKNQTVKVNENNGVLKQNISFTKTINLNHDNTNFSIDFSIPNYINSNSNSYKYRMLGLEENWIHTKATSANFIIQRPGDYVFEVKGANNDGVWNKKSTSLKINVSPSPWLTNWAKAIYILTTLAILFWLTNIIRSRTKLKHRLELEHLENEKNRVLNDAKLQFFTNISHEFRTPLTLITGPLQQLLTDYKGSRVVYKKLLVIESNANRLLQLINRLMDFRKLEHKKYTLEAAEGNIVKFLKEIYLSFSEYARCNGFTYKFYSEAEEILVYYDRPKLEQVFYNLISNAFKYTPAGGNIHIQVHKEADCILICVSDSGPGVPEEFKEKIFDRFFEIPEYQKPANAKGSGTGIGLSIAKSIVDLHKGDISVSNAQNSGAIFKVRLKLGKDHIELNEINHEYKFSDDLGLYKSQLIQSDFDALISTEDLLQEKQKDTILLVEDNVPLRNFIKDFLKDKYNILEAGDGKEALSKALKHDLNLVISDVIMPEMVGTELCAKLKSNLKTSHIPVVLLTSRTALLYKFEGLENGADDYISKPFNITEFKLRTRNLIDSSKRMRTKFSEKQNLLANEIVASSMDENLLKKALEIVESNISNANFDIITFATELGVSRTLLFTKIKAWTNCTPNEFIQELRLKRSAELLEQGNLNISEISYLVGFNNPKYFSKCFQKKYNLSPTAYIQKFSENFFDLN